MLVKILPFFGMRMISLGLCATIDVRHKFSFSKIEHCNQAWLDEVFMCFLHHFKILHA